MKLPPCSTSVCRPCARGGLGRWTGCKRHSCRSTSSRTVTPMSDERTSYTDVEILAGEIELDGFLNDLASGRRSDHRVDAGIADLVRALRAMAASELPEPGRARIDPALKAEIT